MTAKKLTSLILFLLLLIIGGVEIFSSIPLSVSIESIESKTQKGDPVFNKIYYKPGDDHDEWRMYQSHNGINAKMELWDEVKIIVNKKQKPYLVSFHQLKNDQEVELKASCYTCHANGPRVIRANLKSIHVKYSPKDKFSIHLMNLRMKMYGKVKLDQSNLKLEGEIRKIPLKFSDPYANQKLKIKTCLLCHNSDTFWGRGELMRQHQVTIAHLTQTHEMPPWPFKLSESEKKELKRFIQGF